MGKDKNRGKNKIVVVCDPKPKQVDGAVEWSGGDWYPARCYFCDKMGANWEIHLSDKSKKYACSKCLNK